MKKIIVSITSFFVAFINVNAQTPSAVFVTFNDNKPYTARQITRSATDIKVEFLHSHSLYKFNNQGFILNSNGAYPVGTRVSSIGYRDFIKTITNEPNMEPYQKMFVGVRFSDNQIYFGQIEIAATSDIQVFFTHSMSQYIFGRENGVWLVHRIKGGTYQENDKLLEIYLLGELYSFYQ